MISNNFIKLALILFQQINLVSEFLEIILVLSLPFFLGGLELLDLAIEAGDNLFLELVFALDFCRVES